jgi:hypothetical protein
MAYLTNASIAAGINGRVDRTPVSDLATGLSRPHSPLAFQATAKDYAGAAVVAAYFAVALLGLTLF